MSEPRHITGFEAAGRRGERIKIFLDGVEWGEFDAETVVRERLGRGAAIDQPRAAAILATDEAVRARKAAAGYNARKPRTRREIEQYLSGKHFAPAAIEHAMRALTESGTLSDERVAERMIRQRLARGETGPRRLRLELRARGLDKELIDARAGAALEGRDVMADCLALAQKAAKKYAPLTEPKQRAKLLQYLLRRGFPADAAREALRRLGAEVNEE